MEFARETAELDTIVGATHIALSDLDEYLAPAVATLTEFVGTEPGDDLTSGRPGSVHHGDSCCG